MKRSTKLWAFVCYLATASISTAQTNTPPVVKLLGATPFADDSTTISYILYDADNDVSPVEAHRYHELYIFSHNISLKTPDHLTYELSIYPDNRLQTARDVRIFATMIGNDFDIAHPEGSGDLGEGASAEDVQTYTWGMPNLTMRNQGSFAPAPLVLPGEYYLYLVADDGVNEAVFTVSDFKIHVQHAPLNGTAVSAQTWSVIKMDSRNGAE